MTAREIQERARPRVLVVDDDPGARLLLEESLEALGFEVVEASDGIEALERFREHRPDLVLLDVMMPRMDGFAACREIRSLPGGAMVPVLMMTGLDDVGSINRAYDVGETDFVTKPLNYTLLAHRLRYLLRASRAFKELRASEQRLANAQRIAGLGRWEWDIASNSVVVSEEMEKLFEIVLPEEAGGRGVRDLLAYVYPADKSRTLRAFARAIRQRRPIHVEHRIEVPGGRILHVEQRAEVFHGEDGKPLWLTSAIQDVTSREVAQREIRRLAFYDTLTGLPNREAFRARLQRSLEHAGRSGVLAAALLVDLDDFKRINDTLSHRVGDLMLKSVAERLDGCVRATDNLMRGGASGEDGDLARFGGDQFTILLSEIERIDDAVAVARRIIAAVSQPVKLSGHDVVVTPSVGIAIYPNDGRDADTLLMHADTAMHHAKRTGRASFKLYAKSMHARAMERLGIETRLRRAVDGEKLTVFFQPQVDLRTARIRGFEALLRWQDPELGAVPPVEFIAVAEEIGLIDRIGAWVLEKSCAQCKQWHEAGFDGLRIGVNVSGETFRQPGLLAVVRDTLERTGLSPGSLEIELTEGTLMHDVEHVVETLNDLSALGVRIAVDDFGTGYSSLSYLKRFPIGTLKIDRAFVRDVPENQDDAALVATIVAIGKTLRMTVTAEGVETENQLEFLRILDCDEVQGYLLGRPASAENATRLLRETRGVMADRITLVLGSPV